MAHLEVLGLSSLCIFISLVAIRFRTSRFCFPYANLSFLRPPRPHKNVLVLHPQSCPNRQESASELVVGFILFNNQKRLFGQKQVWNSSKKRQTSSPWMKNIWALERLGFMQKKWFLLPKCYIESFFVCFLL